MTRDTFLRQRGRRARSAVYGMTPSHGMAWHGMAWHGMAWHGMAWHGRVPPRVARVWTQTVPDTHSAGRAGALTCAPPCAQPPRDTCDGGHYCCGTGKRKDRTRERGGGACPGGLNEWWGGAPPCCEERISTTMNAPSSSSSVAAAAWLRRVVRRRTPGLHEATPA